MIDASAFPLIIDTIRVHASASVLDALQRTSREQYDAVQTLLARRLASPIVLVTRGNCVIAETKDGSYAGIWACSQSHQLPRNVKERCALAKDVHICIQMDHGDAPLLYTIMCHMRPRVLRLHGSASDSERWEQRLRVPVNATYVTIDWPLVRPASLFCAFPFAINANTVLVTYTSQVPPVPGKRFVHVQWLPPFDQVKSLFLDFSAVAPIHDVDRKDALVLFDVIGSELASASVTLVAPHALFDRMGPTEDGQARQPTPRRHLPPHLHSHLQTWIMMGLPAPLSAGDMSSALARLMVVPADEWEGLAM